MISVFNGYLTSYKHIFTLFTCTLHCWNAQKKKLEKNIMHSPDIHRTDLWPQQWPPHETAVSPEWAQGQLARHQWSHPNTEIHRRMTVEFCLSREQN